MGEIHCLRRLAGACAAAAPHIQYKGIQMAKYSGNGGSGWPTWEAPETTWNRREAEEKEADASSSATGKDQAKSGRAAEDAGAAGSGSAKKAATKRHEGRADGRAAATRTAESGAREKAGKAAPEDEDFKASPRRGGEAAASGEEPSGKAALGFEIYVVASIIFMEIFFRFVTKGKFTFGTTILTAVFAAVWGLVGVLISSIFPPKANRWIRFAFLFLTAIPFLVWYFIFRQFKIYYDWNTVMNGANDVATGGFASHAAAMIFSPMGFIVILGMLMPAIAYLLLAIKPLKLDPAPRADVKALLRKIIAVPACFLIAMFLVYVCGISKATYTDAYFFDSAVSEFGLLTGLRLDFANRGKSAADGFDFGTKEADNASSAATSANESTAAPAGGSAAADTADTSEAQPTVAPEVTQTGYNQYDLDFAALAANDADDLLKQLDTYVSTQTATNKNAMTGKFAGKNLIMICAESFSAEVIDENLTPTLYRLANKGIQFTDYTVPAGAGTTGGEYMYFFGRLPNDGGTAMNTATQWTTYWTIPNQLNRLGYYGKAYHNHDYTYYDREHTHPALGFSDGFMGFGNGIEQFVQHQWPKSDEEMFQGTIPNYIDKEEPFNIYYMTVSGHSRYSFTENKMSIKHQSEVENLPYSERIKAYIACNLDLEAGLKLLVDALEERGIADDTVIVLTADHFPYGVDDDGSYTYLSELYGQEISSEFVRTHNRLIIWSGCLEDEEPITVSDPVSLLDVLPTLSNLFGLDYDSRMMAGRDVFSDSEAIVYSGNYAWKTNLGYCEHGVFTPNSDDIQVTEDYVKSHGTYVSNKITFCRGCLETDYWGHVLEALGISG